MKLFVALCAIAIPSAAAFAPQPSAIPTSETALFSSAWWDQGAGVYSKPSGQQPSFGAIQRAPGAARLIPPQAWQNFSPQGKKRVEGESRKY